MDSCFCFSLLGFLSSWVLESICLIELFSSTERRSGFAPRAAEDRPVRKAAAESARASSIHFGWGARENPRLNAVLPPVPVPRKCSGIVVLPVAGTGQTRVHSPGDRLESRNLL